jgi:hypothetical protein
MDTAPSRMITVKPESRPKNLDRMSYPTNVNDDREYNENGSNLFVWFEALLINKRLHQ